MSADQLSAAYAAHRETPEAAAHFWSALRAYVSVKVRATRLPDPDDQTQVICAAIWRSLPD